jgi:DNA-binding transcriptional LysR family regulator
MDSRLLQYFLAVAREGTISGAARALHVSQPTLSRQIKDLEDSLGCTLFERGSGRGVTLTPEGHRFRRRAEEIVDLIEKTSTEFRSSGQAIGGEVRIGGGESPAMDLVADVA